MGRHTGKLIILLIVGLSLAATGLGMWFRYVQTHEVVEFWGAEATTRIARAEKVEAFRLVEDDAGPISVQSTSYREEDTRDVTEAPGFTNARNALTMSASYQFGQAASDCQGNWKYGLRYISEEGNTVLAFDFECQRTTVAGASNLAGIGPIAEALHDLLEEVLANEVAPSTK